MHAARVVQSVIHMCPLLLIVEHGRALAVDSMGCDAGASECGLTRHGYLFVIQQLTEVRPRCQDPGMAIYQIVLTDYIQPIGVTLRMRL